MKPEVNWTEDYINNVLPSIDEQDWIECKRGDILNLKEDKDAKLTKLAKEISALANSGGGFLAFGIDDKTMEIYDGGVDISIGHNTKEWLENVLPGLIDPPLRHFNVLTITGNTVGSAIQRGKAVYVVDICESEQAPHQSVKDQKYYIRSGSHAIPANHQIVMDILGRRKNPKIDISFNFAASNQETPNRFVQEGDHPLLVIKMRNVGSVLANFVIVVIYIPKYLIPGQLVHNWEPAIIDNIQYLRITRENAIVEIWSPNGEIMARAPGRYVPMLPNSTHTTQVPLCDELYNHKRYFQQNKVKLCWEIFADNGPEVKGEVLMEKIKIDTTLPSK